MVDPCICQGFHIDRRVCSFLLAAEEKEPLEPLKRGGYNAGRPCRVTTSSSSFLRLAMLE
jgi:hypothetical protein